MKPVVKISLILIVFFALALVLAAASVPRFLGPRAIVRAPARQIARAQVAAIAPRLIASGTRTAISEARAFWFAPGAPRLQSGPGDKLVLGGSYTLSEGETLEGSLIVLGGVATLEQGSLVEGDVVLLGGTVRVHGRIEGDVVAIGGLVDLSETALVEGDAAAIGGHVEYEDRASVEGEILSGVITAPPIVIPGSIEVPPVPQIPGQPVVPQIVSTGANWVLKVVWLFFRSFIWAGLAVLVVLFLPEHTERVAGTAIAQPLISGGLGIMTAFVAPILLVAIAITILGIPISMLGLFVLLAAWAFGVVALGTELGKRLAGGFKQEWALPVSAGIGTLLLTLVADSIGLLVPCVGWLVPALVGMLGLGAVLITRFGSQDYPLAAPLAPAAAAAPAIPAPPAPPEPPAPPAAPEPPPAPEGPASDEGEEGAAEGE